MAQRLQRARDEAQTRSSAELGSHISGDEARLAGLRDAIAAGRAANSNACAPTTPRARTPCATPKPRSPTGSSAGTRTAAAQSEAARAGDVERTRIEHLDRQTLDADRRREQLAERTHRPRPGRAGGGLRRHRRPQHDTQKASLEGLDRAGRRTQGAPSPRCRTSSAARRPNWPKCARRRRPRAVACPRSKPCSTPRSARSRAPRPRGCKARGLDSAARVGEKLQVDAGWENAVEGALGQLIEGVLVEAPEALVDALGDLGEGRLTLVDPPERRLRRSRRPRSPRRCSGPAAIRRLLAQAARRRRRWPKRARCCRTLGDGESVITRARRTPRRRLGARGALRRGASRARCCARSEIQSAARARSKTLAEARSANSTKR